ncbi:hypothetical protein DL764_002310 [Monosporascus ibericus]|uniref:Copper acquisition factor BIM1-like domain-containing protein n=1 Tax=Monosporascus ibericus TaxID=155417 RepID=A0A4Q4TL35_9PEZI|nr:hypothetical protein DL764_002310 [Monosporascus ibericus]
MARLTSLSSFLATTLALACGIQAHFTLDYPPPLGPVEDQSAGPCGGYTPDLSTVETTDFHVGGDAIAVSTGHPQNYWLYRITIDDDLTSANWTQVYPIVIQTGFDMYCQPAVTIPEEFEGQTAILSVVGHATDGLLYQCAAVQFVSGEGSRLESCSNHTDVDASFDNDAELASLVGDSQSEESGSPSSPTETPDGAAPSMYGSMQGLGCLVTATAMVLLAAGVTI